MLPFAPPSPPPAHPTPGSNPKLAYIDALRGLAILGVLLVHTLFYGSSVRNIPGSLQPLLFNGSKGVQLFFLASAFTLSLSFDARKEKEPHLLRNFFIRRFFRIAPIYYLGILYYLGQNGMGPHYWLGDAPGITTANILSNVFFVNSLHPEWMNGVVPGGWSISVEMLFYLMFPLLFGLVRSTNAAVRLVVVSVVGQYVCGRLLAAHPLVGPPQLWNEFLYFYLPSQLPIFALGLLTYRIVRENYTLRLTPPTGLLLILLLFAHGTTPTPLLTSHFFFGLAFVVLLLTLSRFPVPVLNNAAIRYIGQLSFSLYIAHNAVFYWLVSLQFIDLVSPDTPARALLNYGLRFGLGLACSLPVAALLHRFVELPMQRLGRRAIKRLG